MMKNPIIYFIAAVLISACVAPFEKNYGLEVDSESYELSFSAREFPVYVYCSGSWTAAFEPEQEWISIIDGFASGTGVGVVKVAMKDNDDTIRTANLVLRSGELQKIVTITQMYNSDRFEIVDYEE